MKNLFAVTVLALSLSALSSLSAWAQPSTTGPAPDAAAPTGVPLDGGASLLLAGGVAYGLRKLRQRKAR